MSDIEVWLRLYCALLSDAGLSTEVAANEADKAIQEYWKRQVEYEEEPDE